MSKRKKKPRNTQHGEVPQSSSPNSILAVPDPSQLTELPVTYQAISDYFGKLREANPFVLRKETFLRIERLTGRPLVCYVAKTRNLPQAIPAYIDDGDLVGFSDLCQTVQGDAADIFFSSNGGSAEATERIVRLVRERFRAVRFIVPSNAYSAATLMCFSGDEIVMDGVSTLGPIDPQINGVPARAILRAFETVEKRLKEEGPRALTAYMPLISKYDLHILEMCKSAQELSKELAANWLCTYMFVCLPDDARVKTIVDFFSSYDVHKSHGRSIDRKQVRDLGLKVVNLENIKGLANLVRSLSNQYEIWFDQSPFYKMFENAHGINWGRLSQTVTVQLPQVIPPSIPPGAPQPGPPERTG